MNLGYLKGLETFITGSYFPRIHQLIEGQDHYVVNFSDNANVYFGTNLTFQIIPYDCLLTNLNCCLSCVSKGQYLMKINLFITKDGTYQTHYRFFFH